MLPNKLSDVAIGHIQSLAANGIAESRIIEFKRDIPAMTDAGKKEFLADVSSFANSIGGDLIFGVEEVDGVATACPGLTGFDADADSLALQSLIRDAVSPRMPVECETILGFPNGPVLVIRVGHSWAAPHMVTFKNNSKFFARGNGGKYQMDVTDLRNSFGLMGRARERIESWIQGRVDLVQDGESPIGHCNGLMVAVHVIPMESFDETIRLQPDDFPQNGNAHRRMQPPTGNAWGQRFNIDGYALVANGVVPSYTQLFRSGKVEKVIVQQGTPNGQGQWELNGHSLDKKVIECTWDGIQALVELGFSMPMLVAISVCNADNVFLYYIDHTGQGESERAFGINQVLAPGVMLEEMPSSLARSLKPAIDVIWNASGLPSSMSFRDGNFFPPLAEDIPNDAE